MKDFMLTWLLGTIGVLSFYAFALSGFTNNVLILPALIGGLGWLVKMISFFLPSSDN